MKKSLLSFAVLIATLFMYACGSEPKEPPPPTTSEKIADEVNKSIEEAFEGMEGGSNELKDALKGIVSAVEQNSKSDVKVVPFREMKALFPDEVAGMNRMDKGEGSTTKMFGINVSTYEVSYGDKDAKVKVQMIDTGGLGKAVMGAVPWATMEVDKETKDGYEMTTEYKGHKAFEKYNDTRESGNLAVLAGERFVVNIEGRGLSMKKLKEARDEIDLDQLIRLGAE